MEQDAGVSLKSLRVDGGMVVNSLLMQFQSDVLNGPVVCPRMTETTALGAAYAAGLAVGYWKNLDDLRQNWGVARTYEPNMDDAQRHKTHARLAESHRAVVWLGRLVLLQFSG